MPCITYKPRVIKYSLGIGGVPEGEVDLVAQDGDTIVFVEVKTRTTHEYGWPEDSVTGTKRRRLQQIAWSYLEAHDLIDSSWRIDVIAIDRTSSGYIKRLEHYVDAVDSEQDLP